MNLLRLFFPCRCDWVWICNGEYPPHTTKGDAPRCGIYQCRKCKAISIGAKRYQGWEHNKP